MSAHFSALRNKFDFDRCFKRGKRLNEQNFVCYRLSNQLEETRLGLMITKRWNQKATRRNQLRRWLKESFRQHDCFKSTDIVVVIRRKADIQNYQQVKSLWDKLKDN